MEENKISTHNH